MFRVQLKCDGTRWRLRREVKGKLANGVGGQYSSHFLDMVYPALLPLMRTPRLPVFDWTDAPVDLNGLVRFAERRNLVSARVPSHFKHSILLEGLDTVAEKSGLSKTMCTFVCMFVGSFDCGIFIFMCTWIMLYQLHWLSGKFVVQRVQELYVVLDDSISTALVKWLPLAKCLLDALAKLRKRLLFSSYLSVLLEHLGSRWSHFMKFDIWVFEKIEISLKSDRYNGRLTRGLTYIHDISCW